MGSSDVTIFVLFMDLCDGAFKVDVFLPSFSGDSPTTAFSKVNSA